MNTPRVEQPVMPGYGVETPEWRGLPWEWAAERLMGTRNYWVVTASATGQPHSLPVWGVWHDAEQRFMFSCAHGSKKARNLASNPQMAFTNDDTVECVSVQGTAAARRRRRRTRRMDRTLRGQVRRGGWRGDGGVRRQSRLLRGDTIRRVRDHRASGRVSEPRDTLAI